MDRRVQGERSSRSLSPSCIKSLRHSLRKLDRQIHVLKHQLAIHTFFMDRRKKDSLCEKISKADSKRKSVRMRIKGYGSE